MCPPCDSLRKLPAIAQHVDSSNQGSDSGKDQKRPTRPPGDTHPTHGRISKPVRGSCPRVLKKKSVPPTPTPASPTAYAMTESVSEVLAWLSNDGICGRAAAGQTGFGQRASAWRRWARLSTRKMVPTVKADEGGAGGGEGAEVFEVVEAGRGCGGRGERGRGLGGLGLGGWGWGWGWGRGWGWGWGWGRESGHGHGHGRGGREGYGCGVGVGEAEAHGRGGSVCGADLHGVIAGI